MNMEYRVVRELLFSRELGSYPSYGIVAVGNEGCTAYIPDISPKGPFVYHLAQRLNHFGASVAHFMDIVIDSLE